jgi:hypothetical protein
MADPGCRRPWKGVEDPQCDDGEGNDADGEVDYPADPECGRSWDDREAPPNCGLGVELVALAPLLTVARRRLAHRDPTGRIGAGGERLHG